MQDESNTTAGNPLLQPLRLQVLPRTARGLPVELRDEEDVIVANLTIPLPASEAKAGRAAGFLADEAIRKGRTAIDPDAWQASLSVALAENARLQASLTRPQCTAENVSGALQIELQGSRGKTVLLNERLTVTDGTALEDAITRAAAKGSTANEPSPVLPAEWSALREQINEQVNSWVERYAAEGRLRSASPRALSIVRLSDVEPETVRYLWHPYIARGKLTIFAGDPGIGKTWAAATIAASVSRGIVPATSTRAAGGAEPVLYLSFEDGIADTLTPRFLATNADGERIHLLRGTVDERGRVFPWQAEDMDKLAQAVEEIRPALVIIDPLQAFIGGHVDFHRANETRAALDPLRAMAEKYGFAALILAHLSKGAQNNALYRILGSVDLTGIARSVLLAGRDKEDPSLRVIVNVKNNLAAEGENLAFRLAESRFEWVADAPDIDANTLLSAPSPSDTARKRDEAQDWLATRLRDGQKATWDQLCDEATSVGLSEHTLRRARQDMGLVREYEGRKPLWKMPRAHAREHTWANGQTTSNAALEADSEIWPGGQR